MGEYENLKAQADAYKAKASAELSTLRASLERAEKERDELLRRYAHDTEYGEGAALTQAYRNMRTDRDAALAQVARVDDEWTSATAALKKRAENAEAQVAGMRLVVEQAIRVYRKDNPHFRGSAAEADWMRALTSSGAATAELLRCAREFCAHHEKWPLRSWDERGVKEKFLAAYRAELKEHGGGEERER